MNLLVMKPRTDSVSAIVALTMALEAAGKGEMEDVIIISQKRTGPDELTINGWSSTMDQDEIIGLMARYQQRLLLRSMGLIR